MNWLVVVSLFCFLASAASLVAFLSMFRNSLIYLARKGLGMRARRSEEPPEAAG